MIEQFAVAKMWKRKTSGRSQLTYRLSMITSSLSSVGNISEALGKIPVGHFYLNQSKICVGPKMILTSDYLIIKYCIILCIFEVYFLSP